METFECVLEKKDSTTSLKVDCEGGRVRLQSKQVCQGSSKPCAVQHCACVLFFDSSSACTINNLGLEHPFCFVPLGPAFYEKQDTDCQSKYSSKSDYDHE